MYIIQPHETPKHPDDTALYVVGEADERKKVTDALVAGAVGEFCKGEIVDDDMQDLLRAVQQQDGMLQTVPERLAYDVLETVYTTSGNSDRLDRLASTAAGAASLVLAQLREAVQVVHDVEWVSREGLSATVSPVGRRRLTVEPSVYDIRGLKPEQADPAVVGLLGAKAYAHQREVVFDAQSGLPSVRSDREHIQLGTYDNRGYFVPLLTVLSSDHPVRKA